MEVTAASRGRIGEGIARSYLERKGLAFVTANWACRAGEIDLVMRDGETLVLVEVRLRSNEARAEAAETVSYQKKRKLLRTARYYQLKKDFWGDIRFDVVAIKLTSDGSFLIEHIEHAFME